MSSEKEARLKPYRGPVGGWGSVKGVTEILLREAIPLKGPTAVARLSRAYSDSEGLHAIVGRHWLRKWCGLAHGRHRHLVNI